MKVLQPKIHGALDYITAVLFALAPSLLHMTGIASTVAYALAGVHLILTLITAFPLGAVKLVPFPVHGVIELLVSLALIAFPWIAGLEGETCVFYTAIGAVIFVVWLLTNYPAASDRLA